MSYWLTMKSRMKKYAKNPNTVASKLDDELVMIDIDLGKYFSMNSIASSIWEYIDTPKTKEEICDELLNEYAVGRATCTQEVTLFLEELIQMKLVNEVT